MTDTFVFADLELSRRLERAEGTNNSRFVDARARIDPDRGATWIEVAGARAMFDGPASPMTQTFGLGLFQPATAADLDVIEAFYAERASPVFHEVSPLADAGLPALLSERGYRPLEYSSVLYRSTGPVAQALGPAGVTVRLIEKGEEDVYARISAAGWSEFGVGDLILELGRVNALVDGLRLFLAELDGEPIAAGALSIVDDIAHLAGASTIPSGRKRGAQLALLDHRLRDGAKHGCTVALMAALPGSSSQRNAERNGFRIAYTRTKWQKS